MRAPAPIDVDALLAGREPIEARRDLEIRITSDRRDVAAWLALAVLAERTQRPSEAIEALEAVIALGGPLGTRWRDEDRARLARLIAARGRARLARGSATALADLERARTLGAAVSDDEMRRAQAARALAALRHSDADTRDGGRRTLAALELVPAWRGARRDASPEQRGQFGVWLWEQGARRAAWDELSVWHAGTKPPRNDALQTAYLIAARWWLPLDRPGPPAEDLVGPARCAFTGCAPRDVVGDEAAERAYLLAPALPVVREPVDAAALAVITLRQALRGEASWGPALAARVDLATFADPKQLAKLPRFAQPVFAVLTGREPPSPGEGTTPEQRLVIAAGRVLAGAVETPSYPDELRPVAATRPAFSGDARAEAVARHASLVVPGTAPIDSLRAMVIAYRRDPAITERLGRDAVAGAVDAAAMHAILGALFDALGDPARARAAWQAAVDASPEPAFVRGLAEAQARQRDPDAALVHATVAAAASGDPAVVWTAISRALLQVGAYVHALEAAGSAIDLSGPETLTAALDIAISASRALGRDAQAVRLIDQRARVVRSAPVDGDPTDADAAIHAHRQASSGNTIARLWVASRWNPRNVELRAALLTATPTDDPRRGAITAELVDLAGDRDPDVRRAAAAALRR